MKRKISIMFTMLLSLFAFLGLTSCGRTNDSDNGDKITLTMDNIENYINLSVYPDVKTEIEGRYTIYYFGGRAVATGITGYTYENVYITIKVAFEYIGKSDAVTFTVKCNVGGNGSGSSQSSNSIYNFKKSWITEHSYYDIISVNGTCYKD